jgi:hypothetical protein
MLTYQTTCDEARFGVYMRIMNAGTHGVSSLQVWVWLRQQVESRSRQEGSRKRKRRIDSDELEPRYRPQPRLQTTRGLSGLQKINKEPSTYRKSIQEVCKQYNLDLDQLMLEVGRSAYLMGLPIFIDMYTEIDTWDVIRIRLHSTAHRSGARMQRIRAKAATRDRAAKNDPLLYVDSGQVSVQTAKLYGEYKPI